MDLAVEACGLVKVYPSGEDTTRILHGVDLSVARGEFLSIMGPSGSGKSTLLHILGLLDRPTEGELRLMGRSVSKLRRNRRALARRHNIGFVFQSFYLLPRMSAMENVMLPLALAGVARSQRRAQAERLLRNVGLGHRLQNRPSKLSGGERQRVAIARALALDPPIILADEPTGNLDSTTSIDIMGLFRRLHADGRTIVQVTHDRAMAQHGDRIVHVSDGRIARVETRPRPRGPVAPEGTYWRARVPTVRRAMP